jgi:hypothetical protein
MRVKFLRCLGVYLRSGNRFGEDTDPEPEMSAAVNESDTCHLCWMYEHYATPYRRDGIAKVNVLLAPASTNPTPCDVLGIANGDCSSSKRRPARGVPFNSR